MNSRISKRHVLLDLTRDIGDKGHKIVGYSGIYRFADVRKFCCMKVINCTSSSHYKQNNLGLRLGQILGKSPYTDLGKGQYCIMVNFQVIKFLPSILIHEN